MLQCFVQSKWDGMKLMKNTNGENIAIIGMGFRFPKANGQDELWKILKEEVECVGELSKSRRTNVEEFLRKKKNMRHIEFENGAYLEEIDKFACEKFHIQKEEARLIDPAQRIFLEVAYETLEDAGYSGQRLKDRKIGVYVGYNGKYSRDYLSMIEEYEKDSLAAAYTGNLPSIIPSRIAYLLDLKGPTMLVDTACSSSIVALHTAISAIKNGDCSSAIIGGICVNLFPIKKEDSEKIGVDSADGRARTFDVLSNGTGWGEGVAAILIKPYEEALKDGDHVYAVVKGSAINQDGYSMGITIPNMESQKAVIQDAIKRSGVNPEKISYIEAHGTGTHIGDPVEIEAIRNAYSEYTEKKQYCGIGSIKTNIGHLQAAAGIAGMIKLLLSFKHMQIPATLNFVQPNYSINLEDSPVYPVCRLESFPQGEEKQYCALSAFGFSGTNSHIILEGTRKKEVAENSDCEEVITLSAENEELLVQKVNQYYEYLQQENEISISDISYTTTMGREHYDCRLAFIAKSKQELCDKMELFLIKDSSIWREQGIFYGYRMIARKNIDVVEDMKITKKEKKEITIQAEEIADSELSLRDKQRELCDLYVKGADISWKHLFSERKKQPNIVPLPVTKLKKVECWVYPKKSDTPKAGMQYNPYWRI